MAYRRAMFNASSPFSRNRGEIDLRAKFDEILYGGQGKIPHGRKIVLRRLRRDQDLKPIACTCKDAVTNEGSPDCSYCFGEGYLWDEEWAVTYSTMIGSDGGLGYRDRYVTPGSIRADYRAFYFRYDTELMYRDKIVEIKLDTEGNVVVPYTRTAIYKPETIVPYRSDYGRIEYIGVFCKEEDAIKTDFV